MAGLIKVTPAELQSASSQLSSGAATINGLLGQLRVLVGNLGTEWAGLGNQRFTAAYEEWQRAQINLHQALSTIAELTGKAAVSYQSNDQSVASTFGSL